MTRLLPSPDACATKAVDALVALRPLAAKHIASGRYGHIIAGWRAQAVDLSLRSADEFAQSRIRSATGQGLIELAASRCDVQVDTSESKALGFVALTRASTTTGGLIPAGTQFRRVAAPDALPIPVPPASYVSTQPVLVAVGAGSPSSPLYVPVEATSTGPNGNVAIAQNGPWAAGVDPSTLEVASRLFDTFAVSYYFVAGGGERKSDAAIRRACLANGLGQYGPSTAAIRAAAILAPGVSRAIVLDDGETSVVHAVDEQWGWSPEFAARTLSAVEPVRGWGCRVASGAVANTFAEVEAQVQLRKAGSSGDLPAIAEALRAAAVAYFDDRDDWYRWSLSGLRAVLSRADRRVRQCVSVTVRDAFTKAPLAPSPVTVGLLRHIYIGRRGVTVTVI